MYRLSGLGPLYFVVKGISDPRLGVQWLGGNLRKRTAARARYLGALPPSLRTPPEVFWNRRMVKGATQFFGQVGADDAVGVLQAVVEFAPRRVKPGQHTRAVEIWGLGGSICVDQHLCDFNAIGLGEHAVDPLAEGGEHFAADFP